MGCNQFSRTPVIISIVSKSQSSDLLKSETINTMSSTNIISLLPSLKSNSSYLKPCLKFKLEKPFSKFILDDINFSDSFSNMLQKIRKFWIFLTAFQNNFEKQIHSVCIKNYSAKQGLVILAVMAVAKAGLPALSFLKSAPFVEFSKDLDELKPFVAFREVTEFLALVYKKKILEKFRGYEKVLEACVKDTDEKKVWLARKGIRFLNEFCDGVDRWSEGVKEFVCGFGDLKKIVLAGAAEVNISGLYLSNHVVHMLIN